MRTTLFLALAFPAVRAQLPPGAQVIAAADARVRWVGRTAADTTSGAVYFDWEGVSAAVTVAAPFTWLTVDIRDACAGGPVGGGSRWAVDIATADGRVTPSRHRIATFFSSPYITTYALFQNQGGRCDPDCAFLPAHACARARRARTGEPNNPPPQPDQLSYQATLPATRR
jgi:hypothetical protein